MSSFPATVAPMVDSAVVLSPAAALPVLTPEATAAADVDPRQVLERWFAGLGKHARYKYRLELRRFAEWATGQKGAYAASRVARRP